MNTCPPRTNLVVVRAGDNSRHETWLGPDRNWDLIVSYFGQDPSAYRNGEYKRVDTPGGKWEGLFELFSAQPDLLNRYEYFWLPDDDIDTACNTVNHLFYVMKHHDLSLAQPSLDPKSYFHHHITVTNSFFRLRYCNFVELMVPCFSSELLGGLIPLFAGRRFGWGMDWIWAYLMERPLLKAAVIDACAVTHTRPYQVGSLYTGEGAYDPEEEAREFLRVLEIDQAPASFVYAGVSRRGRLVKGIAFSTLMAIGGAAAAMRVTHLPAGYRGFLFHLLVNCVSGRGALGPPPFVIELDQLRRRSGSGSSRKFSTGTQNGSRPTCLDS